MKLAIKSATALAPLLVALAACGGGAEEAEQPDAGATPTAAETAAPSDTAAPAPGETPAPSATPSESPSPTPTAAVPPPAVVAASPPAVFNQCKACHDSGIGPSLAGVFGRRAGTVAGFEYSQAMKDGGLTWSQANLDRYLENPRGVVPGTTMAYNGVKDAAQRQAVINYLKTL